MTALILDDHQELRKRFAAFDYARDPHDLAVLWKDIADLLELHAACEETVFYPHLLKARTEDGEDETDDAIGDHNTIRDAVREAARHQTGSPQWWEAVGRARSENSDHLAEEEDGALADFRKHADHDLRTRLAIEWRQFRRTHALVSRVDTADVDPQEYVERNS